MALLSEKLDGGGNILFTFFFMSELSSILNPEPGSGEALSLEFRARFRALDDLALVGAFNAEVGKTGWASARARYLDELVREFDRRGIRRDAVSDPKEGSVSFAKPVRLEAGEIRLR